ncbi:hypothetical protein DY000_02034900 [Brassica cretica]|uniref:F-box domain-containing protein n=1 Tax=Brassica cretica TaxID=69181 RepID=A0ABQ7DN55_BRACR|nr:hypothetical protein DY000_02034900 [Brassica cretica]
MEKEEQSSELPSLTASLPHDLVVDILARVSRSDYPALSLVDDVLYYYELLPLFQNCFKILDVLGVCTRIKVKKSGVRRFRWKDLKEEGMDLGSLQRRLALGSLRCRGVQVPLFLLLGEFRGSLIRRRVWKSGSQEGCLSSYITSFSPLTVSLQVNPSGSLFTFGFSLLIWFCSTSAGDTVRGSTSQLRVFGSRSPQVSEPVMEEYLFGGGSKIGPAFLKVGLVAAVAGACPVWDSVSSAVWRLYTSPVLVVVAKLLIVST